MFEIKVPLGERSYRILVGKGEASQNPSLREILEKSTRVFLITNRTIWNIYSRQIRSRRHALSRSQPLVIPDGERFKNVRWFETLCRELVKRGADRESSVVAFGGGVVGDVTGFVAASVLRGLRYVQVPTTLLAQIDSSIGGKTAINLPEGKNLLGAFFQPSLVISDPVFLKTLPPRELRAGIFEAIKYGAIVDCTLFEFIESHLENILRCDLDSIEIVIRRCASAKAEIVGKDEREAGIRKLLNFGHTVGHALESATQYGRFKHGEAVGWGSLVALRLADKLGMVTHGDAVRMMACIRAVGSLPRIYDLRAQAVLSQMRRDKKAVAGALRFVLPTGIGVGEVVEGVDMRLVRESYMEIQAESTRTNGSKRAQR